MGFRLPSNRKISSNVFLSVLGGFRGVLGGFRGVLGGFRGVPRGFRGVLVGFRGVLGGFRCVFDRKAVLTSHSTFVCLFVGVFVCGCVCVFVQMLEPSEFST